MTKPVEKPMNKSFARLIGKLAAHRGSLSLSELSKQISVAPKTLSRLLAAKSDEDVLDSLLDGGRAKSMKPRKVTARTLTLIKMVTFANRGSKDRIELKDVLQGLGFSADDVHVQAAIDRLSEQKSTNDEAAEHDNLVAQGDIVLRDIQRRVREQSGDPPIEGRVLRWPPYFVADENIHESFGGRFLHRMLNSISPFEWDVDIGPIDLVELLAERDLHDLLYHAIFSMYVTPRRTLSGLDFIEVPGIAAPLGAITYGLTTPIKWIDLLNRQSWRGKRPTIVVVNGDAAHELLAGSCRYDEISTLINDIDEIEVDNVGDPVVSTVAKKLQSLSKIGDPVVFCADAGLVDRVLTRMKGREEDNLVWSKVKGDGDAPTYPIGIAVHGEAQRWTQLLQYTLRSELFDRGVELTAIHYAEFLSHGSSVRFVELPSWMSGAKKSAFLNGTLRQLELIQSESKTMTRGELGQMTQWLIDSWSAP